MWTVRSQRHHKEEHDIAAFFRYTGAIPKDAKRLQGAPGFGARMRRKAPMYTGPLKGLEYMRFLFFVLFMGISALANAAAGSIAQYTLWRANHLPHRILGAIGLVLIVIAFALQAVPPAIDILNQIK